MSLQCLHGVLPPITTPFTVCGKVDEAALVSNVERYNTCGLSGYVVFGSNGEAVHLNGEERRRVLAAVRRAAAPKHGIVAGINELSTAATQDAVQWAADGGADIALVITPYFYKGAMEQEVLYRFFVDVADQSPLPILAYNVPQNTGVTLAPATLARLAEHPQIVGCKDSSGNLGALADTVRRCPAEFRVLVGNAAIFYSALTMGATGAVLAVACAAPRPSVDIFEAVSAGHHGVARQLQDRLAPLGTLVTAELGIAGLKACLDAAGWHGGLPRRPLLPLEAPQRKRLVQVMQDCGFYEAVQGAP